MLDFLRKTVKHTAIYSLGNLSTKIIGLILLPLYTSYLTTSEYGILAILEVTSQFFVTIVGLGISSGMMRWYAVETSEAKKKSIVFTVLSTLVALAITMNLAFFHSIIGFPICFSAMLTITSILCSCGCGLPSK